RPVDRVAHIDAPRDDRGDEDERDARECNAEQVERIHGTAKATFHPVSSLWNCLKRNSGTARRVVGFGGIDRCSADGPQPPQSDHWTASMRLTRSAYLAPYLSHTGLTASWNGFLSAICSTSMPAVFILAKASCSLACQSFRSSSCASRANFTIKA